MNRPMDGEYGDKTAEQLHLFNKPADYREGYAEGKSLQMHSAASIHALAGQKSSPAEYLAGFKTGRAVRRRGIKKALRKVKP